MQKGPLVYGDVAKVFSFSFASILATRKKLSFPDFSSPLNLLAGVNDGVNDEVASAYTGGAREL